MVSRKTLVILSMISGVVCGAGIEPSIKHKTPNSVGANLAIALVAVVFIALNAWQYKKAAQLADPEFSTSAIQRYMRPVAASVCFLIGFFMVALN